MVSEDTLVNIIKEQTDANRQVFDKLDVMHKDLENGFNKIHEDMQRLHEDMQQIHMDFKDVVDRYGQFGDTLKSVETNMKFLVYLMMALLFATIGGFLALALKL